ncbi:uncharacterized protein [Panulirus ornatus]|uniref:uncharacterized protein n=1 Tax=Panulirus ornatus TaxID=150431 RepID=UPI003A853665
MLTRYDPLPDMEVRYVYTTRYYWENIPNNMTDSAGDQTNLFVVTGPFGFGYGISLLSSAKQCQVHQQYNQKADKCSANPADCELGFSMSVWYNTALREDDWDHVERSNIQVEDDLNPTQQIRTIISTGGDTAGHPGMSLYQRGLWLCGVVSTGDQFWQVCSVGHILDLTWTNVGLRWHRTDGLELYVNTDKVAHKRVPESSQAKGALSPPEVMVGCHRDSDNKVYRDFNDASFDEVASWTRQLNDTEVIFFYGGYAEEFAGDDPASFEDKVDMADTMNLDTLAVLYNGLDKITAHHDPPHNAPPPTMATTITTSQGTQSSPTATAPTSTEQTQAQEIKGFQTILGIVSKLTEKDLPSELTPKQCNAMLKLVGTFSNLFGVNNIGKMKALQREKDNPGSAKVIQQMNSWFTNLMRQARYNTSLFLNLTKITENKLFVGHKVNLSQWRASDRDYVTTPNYGVIGRLQEWDFPFDRVAVSHEVVAEETCGERDISLTVIYSRTYHLSAFTTVNPARLPVNRPYALNSRTLTVNVATDPPPGQEDQTDDPECQPKPEDLLEHPIRIKLRHLGHHSFKTRTLKFHENVVAKEHQFERRYCAWWNPLLSDFGSWDTDGCVVIATNDRWTKCACAHLGTYTILAEMVEPKEVPEEQTWLTVLKYVGYFLSFLFIILYVIVIAISSDLKDQFHLMGLHLALAVFLGAIFMLASDLHGVREDRHSCTAIGTLIHFFYQAAGAWVFCLGIASFQAIVSGVIGGRLKAYVAISWGLPFISVGLTYIMFMMDLGDDPRCFISWYNPAKIVFFSFQMVFVLVSIVGATVVLSNMSTPALRKDNLVEDYGSFCGGAAYVMIFFDITWTFAMLAYLRLGFKKPDFYPIFQVLNSWTGLIIFIFIGMGSRRFRMVVAGQAKQRRQMLLGYAFGAPPASRETSPQAPGSPQIQRSQTSSPHPISESDPHTNPSLLEQDTRPHSAISAPHLRPPSRGHVAGRPGSRPASPFI